MSLYEDVIKLQEKLANKVIAEDVIKKIKSVCAVDVSYKGKKANAAAIVMDITNCQVLDNVLTKTTVSEPYVPGLMMLRESKPILSALEMLKENFDVLLVDGNGQLHPRKCGLACFLGIIIGKPTIGIAKSLLCGEIIGKNVKLDGKIVGKIIEKKKGKKIYVSIGNKISLKTAETLVESLIRMGEWQPEPIILADKLSKGFIKK